MNNPIMMIDPSGHSWESFWNGVGNWFSDHWKEIVIGAAFIIGGALVTALTAGAGVGFFAAFGSALLSSTIQVGISMAVSVGIGGFFDNFGDSLASGFMWGGIFAGGAFRAAANAGVATGRQGGIALGKTGIKVLSPDLNNWAKAGGTLIKFGKAVRFDIGAMWGFHMHLGMFGAAFSKLHLPVGALIAGLLGS